MPVSTRSYRDNPDHISRKPLPLRLALSIWSLAAGLLVTGRSFLKPQRTVHFPRQVLKNVHSFHGHIEHIGTDLDPSVPRCISCMMCERACPSGCICITAAQKTPRSAESQATPASAAPANPRAPLIFELDFSLCSLCGLCVEACPVDSLRFSHNIYPVWTSRKEFKIDLLKRLKAQAEAVRAEQAEGSGHGPE